MRRWLLPDAASGHVLCSLADFALRSVFFSRRRPGTIFIEHYACRGTSLNGAANLSPVTKLVAGTGAVSRYKLSRSQKFVTVQDFNCGQMCALPNVAQRSWVSGCKNHYKSVWGAGAKAKSVTTVPAVALAKAGQLTHIVRVSLRFYF